MPLFTTSRKPCARVRTLVKDLARLVPESETLSRGKQSVNDVAESARRMGYPRVAVVTEMHGNPRTIRVLSVSESGWEWLPKQFAVKGVRLCREFEARVRRAEALKAEDGIGFSGALGVQSQDSGTVLKATNEAITFFQGGAEVGPRLSLKRGPV